MTAVQFFNSLASTGACGHCAGAEGRIRIYQAVGVNIRIGAQNALEYRRLNPVGLEPTRYHR